MVSKIVIVLLTSKTVAKLSSADDSTLEKLEQLGLVLDSNWNDQASSDDCRLAVSILT